MDILQQSCWGNLRRGNLSIRSWGWALRGRTGQLEAQRLFLCSCCFLEDEQNFLNHGPSSFFIGWPKRRLWQQRSPELVLTQGTSQNLAALFDTSLFPVNWNSSFALSEGSQQFTAACFIFHQDTWHSESRLFAPFTTSGAFSLNLPFTLATLAFTSRGLLWQWMLFLPCWGPRVLSDWNEETVPIVKLCLELESINCVL